MNRVVFFNHFHNGDIHVSREFVKILSQKLCEKYPGISLGYAHHHAPDLLADIPAIQHVPNLKQLNISEHAGIETRGNVTYINTWYAQQNFKYLNQYGITIDCLYAVFDDLFNKLLGYGLSSVNEDVKTFFPSIDYNAFNISSAQAWLSRHHGFKVLVANGQALSGQAHNFSMTPIINRIAKQHPSVSFILTSKEDGVIEPNIYLSESIIGKGGPDLNENAYLSEFCDVVVGRASGVFTFALTQHNLFERNCRFLCFSNLVPDQHDKFWVGNVLKDKISYTVKFLTTDESNTEKVFDIINESLRSR